MVRRMCRRDSTSGLIQALGRELGGVEIIDDTGLNGLYDFDLSWRAGNLASLQVALHDQLGMSWQERREIGSSSW